MAGYDAVTFFLSISGLPSEHMEDSRTVEFINVQNDKLFPFHQSVLRTCFSTWRMTSVLSFAKWERVMYST